MERIDIDVLFEHKDIFKEILRDYDPRWNNVNKSWSISDSPGVAEKIKQFENEILKLSEDSPSNIFNQLGRELSTSDNISNAISSIMASYSETRVKLDLVSMLKNNQAINDMLLLLDFHQNCRDSNTPIPFEHRNFQLTQKSLKSINDLFLRYNNLVIPLAFLAILTLDDLLSIGAKVIKEAFSNKQMYITTATQKITATMLVDLIKSKKLIKGY